MKSTGNSKVRAIALKKSPGKQKKSTTIASPVALHTNDEPRRYVTVQKAGEISSESEWTWRQRCYRGLVASCKPAGPKSRLLIPLDEIERFLNKGLRPRVA